jgi:hypothetical protein
MSQKLSELTEKLLRETESLHRCVCEFEDVAPGACGEHLEAWWAACEAVDKFIGTHESTPLALSYEACQGSDPKGYLLSLLTARYLNQDGVTLRPELLQPQFVPGTDFEEWLRKQPEYEQMLINFQHEEFLRDEKELSPGEILEQANKWE